MCYRHMAKLFCHSNTSHHSLLLQLLPRIDRFELGDFTWSNSSIHPSVHSSATSSTLILFRMVTSIYDRRCMETINKGCDWNGEANDFIRRINMTTPRHTSIISCSLVQFVLNRLMLIVDE